jgi:hypothetical protein
LIDYQVQKEEFTDPYSMFVYAIRSPYTKESYFRRLRRFFDGIDFYEGETMDKRCNSFAYRGKSGFGRELSRYGMLEFVNIKSVRFYDQLVHQHHVE